MTSLPTNDSTAENENTVLLPSPLPKKSLHFAPYCSPIEFLPPPLEGFAYASMDDQLYIFGGSDLDGKETANLYSFSLKCGWQLVESQEQNAEDKPSARVAAAMTTYGKKLYLFGGVNEKQGWLDDFYEFQTESSTWKRLFDACHQFDGPSSRDKCALIAARDKIYLYGGFGPLKRSEMIENGASDGIPAPVVDQSVSSVESKSDTDQKIPDLENNENGHDQIANNEDVEDEKQTQAILQTAQKAQLAAEFDYYNDFYCFDPSTGKWSSVEIDCTTSSPTAAGDNSGIPPGLAAYNVCTLADKLLYFGGKTSNGERTNAVYCFALGLKKWLPLQIRDDSIWPAGRSFHSSIIVNERYLITFGGRDGDDWERDDLWVLDTNTNQWLSAHCEGVGGVSAPCARYGHVMTVLPDADSRQHVIIYAGSAELDPGSGVAQDVLTDMYVIPADELIQACAPVNGQLDDAKETSHQHHTLHFRRSGPSEGPSSDEPPLAKVPKCDDCIDW